MCIKIDHGKLVIQDKKGFGELFKLVDAFDLQLENWYSLLTEIKTMHKQGEKQG